MASKSSRRSTCSGPAEERPTLIYIIVQTKSDDGRGGDKPDGNKRYIEHGIDVS